MKTKIFILTVFVFILSLTNIDAQTISLLPFVTGFTNPVDIKNAGDSRLFIVEQAGRIMIVDSLGNSNPIPFLNIQSQVSPGGERGLLGLAFHPLYLSNGYFFVHYTDIAGHSRISRFNVTINPDIADPASEVNLLTIYQPYSNHNGGNLMFGNDGYLYINMGDGGNAGDPGNRSQNIDSLLGKILRIDVNNANPPYYFSPSTNPFYGATAGRDEIWAYGVRNPWRASFDRITGDFWIADVGQNALEEINFQSVNSVGGENYGWRCFEGNITYNSSGCGAISNYVFPIAVYNHTLNSDCSVTGGYVYRGGKWADLFGYYFYEDYCSGNMRSIKSDGFEGWIINNNVSTFFTYSYSTFGEDRYGELYIASLSNGTIYKIYGSACSPTAVITYNNTFPDTIYFCKGTPVMLKAIFGDSLSYKWKINGNIISGEISHTYSTDSVGTYTVFVTNGSSCTNNSAAVILVDTCNINSDDFAENNSNIEIYPNPTSGKFVINSKKFINSLEIFNLLGEKIYINSEFNQQKSNIVDLSTSLKGIYFVKIYYETEFYFRKFVVH